MNLTPRPEWDIKDSSKLADFVRCRRYYFFTHILGWRPDAPAIDLIFGQAFHLGREQQLLNGYSAVQEAFFKFSEYYRTYIHPDDEHLYTPKTSEGALMAFLTFERDRPNDLIDNSVVEIDGQKMTEISGKVHIGEGRFLHYRMDSIMRREEDGKIFSWDHKTTKGGWIESRMWVDQFHLSLQNGTYTHCLYCLFPIEQVLGVCFCGTGFEYLKKGSANRPQGYHIKLNRVEAYKTPEQMNSWLWTVNDIVDEIEHEMEKLYDCREGDTTLKSFRMNPKSCTDYRGCPFYDFCLAWQNPLQHADTPPPGFREEFWNPEEMDSSVKKDLDFLRKEVR